MRVVSCVALSVAGAVHAHDVIDLNFYVRPRYTV